MGRPVALAASAAVEGRPPDAGLGTRLLTWSVTSLLMSATLLEVKGLPRVSGKMGWMKVAIHGLIGPGRGRFWRCHFVGWQCSALRRSRLQQETVDHSSADQFVEEGQHLDELWV